MSQALSTLSPDQEIVVRAELTIDELVGQVQKIQAAMERVMRDGEHYGVIPGTDKPTLYKPGAEKLLLLFRLDPEYDEREQFHGDGHYTVTAKCTLWHIPSGNRVASGAGLCTTRESKYAYRNAKRSCPVCGQSAIIKGKQEYGGGWVCFKKQGGCGEKYPDGDSRIEGQQVGQVPNDALPDSYNTVLKMACKRALVAAVLNGTAASDIFTQDIEDSPDAPSPSGGQEAAASASAPPPPSPGPPPVVEGTASASGGEYVFPIGQYKGKPISQVPRDYLEWGVTGFTREDVRSECARYLAAGSDGEILDGDVVNPDDIPF